MGQICFSVNDRSVDINYENKTGILWGKDWLLGGVMKKENF